MKGPLVPKLYLGTSGAFDGSSRRGSNGATASEQQLKLRNTRCVPKYNLGTRDASAYALNVTSVCPVISAGWGMSIR